MWGPDGRCLDGQGRCYSDTATKMTHDMAELWAAQDCMKFLEENKYLESHKTFLFHGDSHLVINFQLRKHNPGQNFNATVWQMMN